MACPNPNCIGGRIYGNAVRNGQLYFGVMRCLDCNPAPPAPEPTPKKCKKHVDLTVREYSEQGHLIQ